MLVAVQSIQPSSVQYERLSTSFSIVIDALRIWASLSVLASHIQFGWFGKYECRLFMNGHDAVIVFFVLSGFVIAYSQAKNHRDFRSFVAARLLRLHSTVIPALLITLILSVATSFANPEFWGEHARGHQALSYFACLLFVQDIWFRNMVPSFNGPMWSLGYEFFYYAIFATVLLKQSWTRWVSAIALALMAGPGIVLLFPIWLFGVASYRLPKICMLASTLIFMISLLSYVTIASNGFEHPSQPGTPPLLYANAFVSDWLKGGLVAVMVYSLRTILDFEVHARACQWMRRIGDLTFPIYVVHLPILALFGAFAKKHPGSNEADSPGLLLVALLAITVVSVALEASRSQVNAMMLRFVDVALNRKNVSVTSS
ncbi:acyltransferase family protein [Rhodopirellula bahusiensis]|uniref:acyltransferase family protein n=1 Tax=Rhodopirellula bahusiensis TaxID=2014065 RepID=UPI003264E5B6